MVLRPRGFSQINVRIGLEDSHGKKETRQARKQAQKEQKCVVNNTEREKGQKTRQAGKQSRHKGARCGGYVW